MKLSVVIPNYNEENTIEKVLNKVLKQKEVFEVIVVDDGSTDNSPEIVKNFNSKKIKFFSHKKNRGKGAAIKTGFSKVNGDFVIIQDADLEYHPKEFRKMLKKASKNTAVYGSRTLGKNKPAYARTYIGNIFLTLIGNILYGLSLTDSYTCYKLIPAKTAKQLNIESDHFELEAEITSKLAKKGVRIVEVPISYSPRTYEQGKKIKAIDALKGIYMYLKIRVS